MTNNWNKTKDRQDAYKSGNAVKHSKGQGGVGYPIKTAKDAKDAAALLKMHGHKYTPEQRQKIKAHIKKHAKRLGASINLANDTSGSDFGNNKTGSGQEVKKGQKGKTRAQPRAFGGKFGKKGATSGESSMAPEQVDPEPIVNAIGSLQIGQSLTLIGGAAKVKKLTNGYQLYKVDGSQNEVVKDIKAAMNWARGQMKGRATA